MKAFVQNDSITFFKLLVSQGFDLWLTQACFPVCEMKKLGVQMGELMNIDVLRRVRQLVETDFCRDRSLVSDLDPALLRLIHKVPDRSKLEDFSSILNLGDTTDEDRQAENAACEDEKKGKPDEDVKEEEKKEIAEEEDKKSPEMDKDSKAKHKADKQEKLKSIKEQLQKMKIATIWEVW